MCRNEVSPSAIVSIIRSGFWLYGVSILNNLFGFVYWFAISHIGGAQLLGLTSATVSLASMVSSILSLGIPTGLMRFLGIERGRREGLARYLWSSAIFLSSIYLSTSLALLVLSMLGVSVANFSPSMFRAASILVALSSSSAFTTYLISTLRTRTLFLSVLIGNLLKLGIGIEAVYLGLGWFGAVLGYASIGAVNLCIGLYMAVKTLGVRVVLDPKAILRVLKAGLTVWIPSIIAIVGQWLSVLFVFGVKGATETGYYYLAFTITGLAVGIATSMTTLLIPILSGMKRGRGYVSYTVMRLGLAIVSPIVFALLTYPHIPLELLGPEYVAASNTLRILLLSSFATIVLSTISNYMYSLALYRHVTSAGILQTTTRLLLYIALVREYGGLGVAIAYSVGTYVGLGYAIVMAKRLSVDIDYRRIATIAILPGLPSVLAYTLNLCWLLGLPIIASTYLIYMKLRLITRKDLQLLAYAILSRERVYTLYTKMKPLIDLLIPE